MRAINDFEHLLQHHSSTEVLKFYLHISPEEQQERLRERINDKAKQWKYNENDFTEAKLWDDYMAMYEIASKTVMIFPGSSSPPIKTGIRII